MAVLTLQIHDNRRGWLDAATIAFSGANRARLEYDVDYAAEFIGRRDRNALSVAFPVDLKIHDGPLPGFVLDLIPQGEPLRRLLRCYALPDDASYEQILTVVPLAPPGNIRIKEPWEEIESQRSRYRERGFTRDDVILRSRDFIEYMTEAGAPIGGTSGAGGGSPKFLLREDAEGRLHADGWLDDRLTRRAILVKLPYTDSENARMLAHVEKAYYDLLRELPIRTGPPLQIIDDTLFITRFDRIQTDGDRLSYYGLESFYAAHGVNVYGALLRHEDNLGLIVNHSTIPQADALEYLCRDVLNHMLANTDNHGRNTSLLKTETDVMLSPIYDITAMQFFEGDFILELTRWGANLPTLESRVVWMVKTLALDEATLRQGLRQLAQKTHGMGERMLALGVPEDIVQRSADQRARAQAELEAIG